MVIVWFVAFSINIVNINLIVCQLAESVLSKISAVNGHESDATAFNGNDLNEFMVNQI